MIQKEELYIAENNPLVSSGCVDKRDNFNIINNMVKKAMQTKEYSFTVMYEPVEEGGYTVTVPSLPGCITEGDTLEQARLMARDAIKLYCESLLKDREIIPQIDEEMLVGRLNVELKLAKA